MKRIFIAIICFLSIIILSSLYEVQAASWCKPEGDVELLIKPQEKAISYVFDRSFRDLSKVRSDTENPYAHDQLVHTFGLAHRKFDLTQNIEYKLMTYPRTKEVCLWFDKITVDVQLKPTIYIAREYPKNSCHFNHVLDHEKEHVQIDREVTAKYMKILQSQMAQYIRNNRIYGPIRKNLQQTLIARMERDVTKTINQVVDKMEKERAVRQSAIDSLESYEATSRYIKNVCDKKHPQIAKARDNLLRRIYGR